MEEKLSGWVNNNFSNLAFTDIRRTNRVMKIASAMSKSPGNSIPQLCKNFYDVKATYNLFKHEEATPDVIQASHRKFLQHGMQKGGSFLLIEDTSDISYSSKKQRIAGLGPIGQGEDQMQGFLLHSTLLAKWESPNNVSPIKKPSIAVLGLIDQQYVIRQPALKKDGKKIPKKSISIDDAKTRESIMWQNTPLRISQYCANKNAQYVRICDRAADIYEVLLDSQEKGFGFVIRAAQNRKLAGSENKLFDLARQASSLGSFELFLRNRPEQPARTARLQVSTTPVIICPSRRKKDWGKFKNIACSVVRVWEEQAPEKQQTIEWFLLCDQKITTFAQAINCALQYSCRWLIEDYHKALKTGLGAEKLQLESANRLFAAIAIMSIVALRLIAMREQFRTNASNAADQAGLTTLELKVLLLYFKRKIETVYDVGLAIGRLGGHLNRKGDGPPGLITLWRGMLILQNLIEGYKIGFSMS
jgi:hypothetical protein